MALAKTGYRDAYRGVTVEKVPLNADGNIAQAGETFAGSKRVQISQVNAANDLEANEKVFEFFYGLVAGAQLDHLTNTMRVNWSVK